LQPLILISLFKLLNMKQGEVLKHVSSNRIDELERVMVDNFTLINCPLKEYFSDGVYVREVTLPKGALVTSKIHKTQHHFFIMKGKVVIWIDGVEKIIKAPFIGITEPGTRRVVYALEKSIWATSHANPDNENSEQIEERIIEKHDNPLLSLEIKERVINLLNEKL